jgi:hypothetical protein
MKKFVLCLVVIVLFAVGLVAQAQANTLTFADGSTFTLPRGWTIVENSEDAAQIENSRAETVLKFFFYSSEKLQDERIDTPAELAEYDFALYDASQEQPFDEDKLKDSEIANLEAVEYLFQGTSTKGTKYDITVIYFLMPNGGGFGIEVSPTLVDSSIDFDLVYDVLNTLEVGEGDGSTQTGRQDPTEEPTEEIVIAEGTEFVLIDGTTLSLPDGWTGTDGNDASTKFLVAEDGSFIYLFIEAGVGGMSEFDTPDKYLAYVYKNNYKNFDSGEVQDTQLGGLPAATYDFNLPLRNGESPSRMVTILLPNTNYITAYIVPSGDFDEGVQTGLDILDSVVGSDTVLCFVFAPDGVNLRATPTTSGAVVRKVDNDSGNGDTLIADYVTQDGNGALWFHLVEDNAFARQDVVFYDNNSCGNLPVQ